MARGKIEGIIVEIGGDTTGLRDSLKQVNKSLNSTQSELREVNKLLKLDPGNTELLSQKQRLLGDAVADTEKKLEALKQASDQAKASLESGTLGQEKYDALKREIIKTEQNLEGLKAQATATDSALKSSTSGLQTLGTAASDAGDKVSGVSKAAAGLAGGAVATVPATQELRRDLSFLEQNAKEAGIGIGATEKAFKTFNAVSGETDSSVEAVSNLLQAGFTESNLQLAVEGVSGAMSRFPDTLKIESLADSIQETVATGKSIGQFSEYLDRAGIGAANFDAELAKCDTQAERTDLVLQTLANTGANDTYDAWRENNSALADYDDAMIDLQMALGDLATAIAPVVTALAELATAGLEGFNKLPTAAKGVVGGLVGITAAASPTLSAVGKISIGLDALTKNSKTASGATKVFSSAGKGLVSVLKLVPTPMAAVAGGAAALGIAIYGAVQSMNQETKAAEEMSEAHKENIATIKGSFETADEYAQKLDVLSQKENKSAQDKTMMQAYVDQLNGSIEGLNLTYDAETDKLNMSTDAVYKKIDAMKEEAVASAYIEQSKESLDAYAQSQMKLEDAQERLNSLNKEWNGLSQSEKQVRGELRKQIEQQEAKVNDLTNATSKYWQEYQKEANKAAMVSGQWDALVQQAEQAGINIPKSLETGIRNGKYVIPTTLDELKALITFDDLATSSALAGSKTVQNLSAQLAAGEITAQEAAAQLSDAVNKQLNDGATKAGSAGSKTGQNYSSGVKGQKGNASGAGTAIGSAAAAAAGAIDFYSTGYNDGVGYANGLRGAVGVAREAGRTIANAALAAAQRASEQHSPSKKWARSAEMDIAGYVNQFKREIPEVRRMGESIAVAALSGVDSISKDSITANVAQQFDYAQMYEAMREANKETQFTIVLNNRELGRGLRGMGVQFG